MSVKNINYDILLWAISQRDQLPPATQVNQCKEASLSEQTQWKVFEEWYSCTSDEVAGCYVLRNASALRKYNKFMKHK